MRLEGNQAIAVFSLAYAPFVGGAELAVQEITKRLPGRRFICFSKRFFRDTQKDEALHNMRILRLGKAPKNVYKDRVGKIMYVFQSFYAAAKMHKREKFAAVWAVMASYGGFAALIFKIFHPRVPLLLTLQEGDAEGHILSRVGALYPFWRLIFSKADRIQAISAYLADFARRHGARCPIDVIPNGVSFEALSKPENNSLKIIITTSRLVAKNGIDILIRAFAKLPIADCRLRIVGEGPEKENLKALSKILGVSDRVEFVGGVAPERIHTYLRAADIFVRASRSEGLGSSFLEAMAAGLPVIGTRVGGIPDFLKDMETGIFAVSEDSDDLSKKMILLLQDATLRDRLSRNAMSLVTERYAWEKVVKAMDVIFEDLHARPRVVIATGIFPPDIGGSATYSELLKKELPAYGYKAAVLTYGNSRIRGVYSVSNALPKSVKHLLYLMELLSLGLRADLILAADSSFGAAFLSAVASFILRRRLIVRVTGDYAWEQGQQRFGVSDLVDDFQNRRYGAPVELLRRLQSFTLRTADLVIAPSAYLKKIVVGWGVDPAKIVVIYNAVSAPVLATKESARKTLKLGFEDRILISAGRLVPWKGFSALLDGAYARMKTDERLKLFIIGDGPEKIRLQFLVNSHNLRDKVILTGALPRGVLNQYLCAADGFILNTAYEGFSHQIVEAMAHGLPVLTTPAGGNLEIIRDGENGIFFDYNSVQGMARAIERLYGENGLARRLKDAGIMTATRFTQSSMLAELNTRIKFLL